MTRTKMSDGTHDVRTKPPGHSDRIYGQLQDICSGVPDSRTENGTDSDTVSGELQSGHGTGHTDAEKNIEAVDLSVKMDHVKAASKQVNGDHYVACGIQPRDYARANGFVYEEVLALRYLTRHRRKNGKQDLLKLIHCIELLIEAEYD